jgi:hypothetical protein
VILEIIILVLSSHYTDFYLKLSSRSNGRQRSNARPVKITEVILEIVTIFFPAGLLAVAVGDEVTVLAVILAQPEVALLGTVAFADSVKSAH